MGLYNDSDELPTWHLSWISHSQLIGDDVKGGRRLLKECVNNSCFLWNGLCCQTCCNWRIHTVHNQNWHNRKAAGHLQWPARLVDGSRREHILRLGCGRLFAGWEWHYWSDTLHWSLQGKVESLNWSRISRTYLFTWREISHNFQPWQNITK